VVLPIQAYNSYQKRTGGHQKGRLPCNAIKIDYCIVTDLDRGLSGAWLDPVLCASLAKCQTQQQGLCRRRAGDGPQTGPDTGPFTYVRAYALLTQRPADSTSRRDIGSTAVENRPLPVAHRLAASGNNASCWTVGKDSF